MRDVRAFESLCSDQDVCPLVSRCHPFVGIFILRKSNVCLTSLWDMRLEPRVLRSIVLSFFLFASIADMHNMPSGSQNWGRLDLSDKKFMLIADRG